jgi:hypothetical protein
VEKPANAEATFSPSEPADAEAGAAAAAESEEKVGALLATDAKPTPPLVQAQPLAPAKKPPAQAVGGGCGLLVWIGGIANEKGCFALSDHVHPPPAAAGAPVAAPEGTSEVLANGLLDGGSEEAAGRCAWRRKRA